MPRPLPPDYFTAPPFTAAGPELFRTYTCLGCGARAATWAAFRAHRVRCHDRLEAAALVAQPAALLAPDPPRGATGAPGDRDPFLDAPAAALRRLEAWRRALDRAAPRAAPAAPGHAPPTRRPARPGATVTAPG